MATVVQLPGRRGFGAALGEGVGAGIVRAIEQRQQQKQSQQALKLLQGITSADSREAALDQITTFSADPSFAMDPQDMIAAMGMVDRLFPIPASGKAGTKVSVKGFNIDDGTETLIEWDKGSNVPLEQQALNQGKTLDVTPGAAEGSDTAAVMAGRGLLAQQAAGLRQDMGPRSLLSSEDKARFDRQMANLDPANPKNIDRSVFLQEQVPRVSGQLETLMGDRLGKEFVTAIKNKGLFLQMQRNIVRLMVRGDPDSGNPLPFNQAVEQVFNDLQEQKALFREIEQEATKAREAAAAAGADKSLSEKLSDRVADVIQTIPEGSKLRALVDMFSSGDPSQRQIAEAALAAEEIQHSWTVDGQRYDMPALIDRKRDDAKLQLITWLTVRYNISRKQAKQLVEAEFKEE